VLIVATAGVLPEPLSIASVGLALASLCWSFGRDVRWLFAARDARAVPAPAVRTRKLETAATATNG
jgi:hypothetical protein